MSANCVWSICKHTCIILIVLFLFLSYKLHYCKWNNRAIIISSPMINAMNRTKRNKSMFLLLLQKSFLPLFNICTLISDNFFYSFNKRFPGTFNIKKVSAFWGSWQNLFFDISPFANKWQIIFYIITVTTLSIFPYFSLCECLDFLHT